MIDLTLADEIVVLMLGDDTGEIKPARVDHANIASAAGILMELSLINRIDTDLTSLFIIDRNPVGDALLDGVLREIAAEPVNHPSAWWIERLVLQQGDISRVVLGRL